MIISFNKLEYLSNIFLYLYFTQKVSIKIKQKLFSQRSQNITLVNCIKFNDKYKVLNCKLIKLVLKLLYQLWCERDIYYRVKPNGHCWDRSVKICQPNSRLLCLLLKNTPTSMVYQCFNCSNFEQSGFFRIFNL